MVRIDRIAHHPLWLRELTDIECLEKDRPFCGHDRIHFLDVARLAQIENLETGLGVSKALIYAAALLHDIGRARQYRDGTPHDLAGAELAEEILADCGFDKSERQQVKSAILAHRDPGTKTARDLSGLLYRADKASRMCLFCPRQQDCNWPDEKKNLTLKG